RLPAGRTVASRRRRVPGRSVVARGAAVGGLVAVPGCGAVARGAARGAVPGGRGRRRHLRACPSRGESCPAITAEARVGAVHRLTLWTVHSRSNLANFL